MYYILKLGFNPGPGVNNLVIKPGVNKYTD